MFRSRFDFKVNDLKIDENGRYIILDLTVYEQRLTFVCLYGYNTDVPQFFTDILYKSAEFVNKSYLFCGDWNAVQNKSDDTYNVLHDRNINARKKIDEMKETFELLDPWRTCYSDDRKYTWRQPSPVEQSRIDYFLVSEDMFALMENTKIISGYRTDHSAIVF